MGFFSSVKQEVEKVEHVIEQVEQIIETDVHAAFGKAKAAALSANAEVAKLKSDLQVALAKAADLHQKAIDAAKSAQAKAEQDVADMKAAIAAHTADMNTQASQITSKPAPVVDPNVSASAQ